MEGTKKLQSRTQKKKARKRERERKKKKISRSNVIKKSTTKKPATMLLPEKEKDRKEQSKSRSKMIQIPSNLNLINLFGLFVLGEQRFIRAF